MRRTEKYGMSGLVCFQGGKMSVLGGTFYPHHFGTIALSPIVSWRNSFLFSLSTWIWHMLAINSPPPSKANHPPNGESRGKTRFKVGKARKASSRFARLLYLCLSLSRWQKSVKFSALFHQFLLGARVQFLPRMCGGETTVLIAWKGDCIKIREKNNSNDFSESESENPSFSSAQL